MISELNLFYYPSSIEHKDSSIWEVAALARFEANNGEPELYLRKNLQWDKINLHDKSSPFFNYFYIDNSDDFTFIKRPVVPKNYDYLIFLWDFWHERIRLYSTDFERFCSDFEVEDYRDWHPYFSREFANTETNKKKINYVVAKKPVKIDQVLSGYFFRFTESKTESIVYELVGTTDENDERFYWIRRNGRWVNAGAYLEYPNGKGWNEEPDMEFIDELKADEALKTWDEYEQNGLLVPLSVFDKYLIN